MTTSRTSQRERHAAVESARLALDAIDETLQMLASEYQEPREWIATRIATAYYPACSDTIDWLRGKHRAIENAQRIVAAARRASPTQGRRLSPPSSVFVPHKHEPLIRSWLSAVSKHLSPVRLSIEDGMVEVSWGCVGGAS